MQTLDFEKPYQIGLPPPQPPEKMSPNPDKEMICQLPVRTGECLNAVKWGRAVQPPSELQRDLKRSPPPIREVLETFEGRVDAVHGQIAYITMRSPQGEVLEGRYPASEFSRLGIVEGKRFRCSTIRTLQGVQVVFELLASRVFTDEELGEIERKLDLGLTDDDLRDAY